MITPTDPWLPFWRSGRMTGESVLFIEPAPGMPATASLLLTPRSAVSLASASGQITSVENVDFIVDSGAGMLIRTPASRLPMMTHAELHPSLDPDGSGFMHRRNDPASFLVVDELGFFHRRQASAGYTFDPAQWTGYAPPFAGDRLPRTLERLRQREALTVCLLGDSISEGYNASSFIDVPPRQPSYGGLVAAGLEYFFGCPVTLHNLAAAGSSSGDGRYLAGAAAAAQPHLVLIAYGMNDSGFADPADYGANILAIIDGVRRLAPRAEFILVSSMLPNPEWHYPQLERFESYRTELITLCGEGVVLADMTTLWADVMLRKSPYDMTGNGINHPNDFGHRLYSQAILSLLVD